MDQEITSAINRELFHQKALAHNRIINTKRNAKAAITAITHLNAKTEMASQYCDINITAAWKVEKGCVDIDENESWGGLKMHTVPLIWYIGKHTEGMQMM